jgi:hypothetical protein
MGADCARKCCRIMALNPGDEITQAQLNALAASANSKEKIQELLDLFSQPNFSFGGSGWKTEMERMRGHIAAVASQQNGVYRQNVSGPWPVSGLVASHGVSAGIGGNPNGPGTGGGFSEVDFYYEDTGNPETLTCVWRGLVQSVDPAWKDVVSVSDIKELNVRLLIGGDRPVRFRGVLSFICDALSFSDPIPPAASCSTIFPGASFEMSDFDPVQRQNVLYSLIDSVVSPGIYEFHATIHNPDDACFHNALMLGSWIDAVDDEENYIGTTSRGVELTVTISESQEVNAIHSTKSVRRISAPRFDTLLPYPMGIYGEAIGPAPDRTVHWNSGGHAVNYEASTVGYFTGKTPPISTIGADQHSVMPWNITGLNQFGNVTYRNPPHEEDSIPVPIARWQALTNYAAGTTVLDSHGYWQTRLTAGQSGAVEPSWNTTLNGITLDNTYQWRLMRKDIPSPSKARIFAPPAYPVFKDTDIGTSRQPAVQWPHWSLFRPEGWFIYEVRLNRLGQPNEDGILVHPGTEIPVTLGCIRNGSFVAFGTWNTGSRIGRSFSELTGILEHTDAAFWPIFTRTELCYQASERVDVQAMIVKQTVIKTVGGASGTYGAIGYPISVAHFNDLMEILKQL